MWTIHRRAVPAAAALLAHSRAALSTEAAAAAATTATAPPPRLLRSVLYVPGANAKALDKAKSVAADVVILDLEDGSGAPDLKEPARANVVAALSSSSFQPGVVVRINGLESEWFTADVEAVAKVAASGFPLAGVCLPKVNRREDVAALATALTDAGAPPTTPLWAMIESPLGVINAASIASTVAGGWDNPALPLACLVAGTTDLTADLRARPLPGRAHLSMALQSIVQAGRAYGLGVLDGVSLTIPGKGAGKDKEGKEGGEEDPFLSECQQGRSLGFDGKTLIHPAQITPANGVFGPSQVEVEVARRVLQAWEEARAQGKGVAVLQPEGRLVENLHAVEAQRTLALAQAAQDRDNLKARQG